MSLFNFFCDFIFYDKIAFRLISYVAKMLAAKMLTAKIWTHTPPKHPSSPQRDGEKKIIYKAIARCEGEGIFFFWVTEATKVAKWTFWWLSWEINRLRCRRGLGSAVGWQWVGNRGTSVWVPSWLTHFVLVTEGFYTDFCRTDKVC